MKEFERFLKEKEYLLGLTAKTIRFYKQSFAAFGLGKDFSKKSLLIKRSFNYGRRHEAGND